MKKLFALMLALVMLFTIGFSANAATLIQTEEIETMAYREIPAGAVEIQTGLYWHTVDKVIGGNTYTFGYLYSAEGYCFYELTQPENYDEEGNLKPANERVYAIYASVAISTDLSNFVSVPVEDGYEIVRTPNSNVTA